MKLVTLKDRNLELYNILYKQNNNSCLYIWYSLKLNRNTIRLEIQENPDILFKNLLIDFIRDDNYQRLIELLIWIV